MKPILVGEANPYNGDPAYALWPDPPGASGDRLCRAILGLERGEYFRQFHRVNLCPRTWSLLIARARAEALTTDRDNASPLVLLGAKVCRAFGVKFEPWVETAA